MHLQWRNWGLKYSPQDGWGLDSSTEKEWGIKFLCREGVGGGERFNFNRLDMKGIRMGIKIPSKDMIDYFLRTGMPQSPCCVGIDSGDLAYCCLLWWSCILLRQHYCWSEVSSYWLPTLWRPETSGITRLGSTYLLYNWRRGLWPESCCTNKTVGD